ncbi:MAG: ArnT family glycosyltransferase [bacterium]
MLTASLAIVFIIRFGLELWNINQPIFEGYIGRQVPTAMVARGLARGDSFFYPKLQTGPFPSYFLVEPPIYAWLVARLYLSTGMAIETSARLVSMAGTIMTLAGIGLWVWRMIGRNATLFTWIVFLSMPVSIRFGRACQPDSLALGLVLLGIGIHTMTNTRKLQSVGIGLLTLGFATKITLLPLGLMLFIKNSSPFQIKKIMIQVLVVFLISMSWYGWAFYLKSVSETVAIGQANDGMDYWWKMVGPFGLSDLTRLRQIILNIAWRAWTPLVSLIIMAGVMMKFSFRALALPSVALIAWLMLVGAKAHHGYYWLVPSPAVAMACGLVFSRLADIRPAFTFSIFLIFVTTGFWQSRSTWDTPEQWLPLVHRPDTIIGAISSSDGSYLIADEATVYALDQPGLRWEWPAEAQNRAARAWGGSLKGPSPLALLEFYRKKGGRWFLVLETDPQWQAWHQQLSPLLSDENLVDSLGGLLLYDLNKRVSDRPER